MPCISIQGLLCLIRSDLYRIGGAKGFYEFLKKFFFHRGCFQYCFWMRICSCLHVHRFGRFALFYWPARLILYRCSIKYGIDIPYEIHIGSGFLIGHFGGIVVNYRAEIGKNCNISHDVTIGKSNRGDRAGVPVIGDNVYIGPGAKIIGKIKVGNNVAIGANCVVTKDVPDHAVLVGVPARIVSMQGSAGYVNFTDYIPCNTETTHF